MNRFNLIQLLTFCVQAQKHDSFLTNFHLQIQSACDKLSVSSLTHLRHTPTDAVLSGLLGLDTAEKSLDPIIPETQKS